MQQIQYHFDKVEAECNPSLQRQFRSSPYPTLSPKVTSPSKTNTLKISTPTLKKSKKPLTPRTRTPTTPSEYDSVKKFLKIVEETMMEIARDSNPRSLRDCTIIDVILIDRDYVPQTQAEILENQNEELMTINAQICCIFSSMSRTS